MLAQHTASAGAQHAGRQPASSEALLAPPFATRARTRALPALVSVDKRLDEWVGQERVGSIAKAASADALHRVASGGGSGDLGDQKMTRRLKRQYTEILHVPAALEELPPIDQAGCGLHCEQGPRSGCGHTAILGAVQLWKGGPGRLAQARRWVAPSPVERRGGREMGPARHLPVWVTAGPASTLMHPEGSSGGSEKRPGEKRKKVAAWPLWGALRRRPLPSPLAAPGEGAPGEDQGEEHPVGGAGPARDGHVASARRRPLDSRLQAAMLPLRMLLLLPGGAARLFSESLESHHCR